MLVPVVPVVRARIDWPAVDVIRASPRPKCAGPHCRRRARRIRVAGIFRIISHPTSQARIQKSVVLCQGHAPEAHAAEAMCRGFIIGPAIGSLAQDGVTRPSHVGRLQRAFKHRLRATYERAVRCGGGVKTRRASGPSVGPRHNGRLDLDDFLGTPALVKLATEAFKGQTLVKVGSIGKERPKRVLKRHLQWACRVIPP